jgi:hypothetical protein
MCIIEGTKLGKALTSPGALVLCRPLIDPIRGGLAAGVSCYMLQKEGNDVRCHDPLEKQSLATDSHLGPEHIFAFRS